MPRRRMHTRVIKEVLRLRFSLNRLTREISRSVNRSRGAVHKLISKAEEMNLGWPLPEDIDDDKLEQMLYAEPEEASEGKASPDWSSIHRELKRSRVTRLLLWEEYRDSHFCTISRRGYLVVLK